MKLYTEEQVRFLVNESRDCVNWWDIKYDLTQEEVISQVTPIELPSDEEIEKIAQWVIDNRYPKSEFNKVSDFEMYHHIIKLMKETILNQNK